MKKVFLIFLGLIISLAVVLILQPKTAVAQVACTSNADCTDPSFCQANCNDADCIPRGYCSCRNNFCVQSCDFNADVCIERGGTQCGTVICSDCVNPYTCAPCPPAPTCSNTAPNDKFRVCYFDGTNPDTGDASKFKHEEDEPGIPSPVGNYGQYVIDHSWGYGQIDSTGFENYVSGKWRGRINFTQGTYQFFVNHDDGVTVDLDGYGRIIDQWNSLGTHWSSLINLPAGYRNITLRWYEGDGNAEIKLIWNYNAPPTPTVNIKANNSDGPISVSYNTSANLTWSSTNAFSCTASKSWSGSKALSNNTGESTGNLTSSRIYTLTCCNNAAGLCSSDSVTVNVGAAPPAPTVSISAASTNISYNTSTTITWSSTNATNGCSVSPSGWTGTSGAQSTGNLTASRTYTATCYNAVNQSASASVTVNVGTLMDFNLTNQEDKTVFKGSGETASNIFTVTSLGGSQAVNLSYNLASGTWPTNITFSALNPASCTPPSGGACTTTANMTSSSTATSGTVTVRGQNSSNIHDSNFALTVWDQPSATTTASCTGPSTSYNITWGGQTAPANSWADISTDSTFATYFHKNISGTTSTTAPSGFTYYNSAQLLTLNPSTTYYVRLYINSVNNATTRSFTTPAACVIPMDFSLSNQGDKTVFTGETASNIFTANWLSDAPEAVNWSVTQKPANVSNTLAPTSCTPPVSGSCATTATFTPSSAGVSGAVIAEGRTTNTAKASAFNLTVWDQPSATTTASCTGPSTSYNITWGGQIAPANSWADISTGSSPTITTVDPTGPGLSTSAAIGSDGLPSDGLPIVSYIVGGTSLRVTKCGNASCSSGNTTTTVSTASNVQRETSIAIGADGLPIITFVAESAGNGLLAVKCGNATCSSGNTITVVFSITGPPAPETGSIAIGANGNPVIAYQRSSSSTRLIQCGNTACSSGNIDTLLGTGNERNARVAVGTDGFPIIAYRDAAAGSAKVVHCGNAGCTSNNITTMLNSSGVGHVGGIAIAGGVPVISYYDSTNGDLKFIRCGNVRCDSGNTTTTVNSTGNVGDYSSVTIGMDGLPLISYYDSTNGDLKVAKCSNNACSSSAITSVDTTGNVGLYTSVAIGSDALPFISYYDATNTDMKAIKCTTAACDGAPSWNNNYYHKDISGLSSTTAPSGFGYFDGSRPDLTLSPNTPYYVRLFINGVNNTTTNSFTTPTATCVTATCTGSPITVKAGDAVTWTAVPSGGSPPYAYSWSGTDLLSGTINPVTKTYSSLGAKSASVTVTDSSSSVTSACSNTVFVNTPAFIKLEGDVHSQKGINAN